MLQIVLLEDNLHYRRGLEQKKLKGLVKINFPVSDL